MNRAELKMAAKQQIQGKIGILFVINLVIVLVSLAANIVLSIIPFVGSLAYSLLVPPAFSLALMMIYLAVAAGDEVTVSNAFDGFHHFWAAFKTSFFSSLFIMLWSLLFVIPGIIKSFSYAMAMYITAENPGISGIDAVTKSKEMMEGYKMELFILSLSFIGWILLGTITFGIAYIWIVPYMQTTYANFYNKIKPQVYVQNEI